MAMDWSMGPSTTSSIVSSEEQGFEITMDKALCLAMVVILIEVL
jgi:hypothetical protein